MARTAFVTSRLADFADKDTLVRLIGHPPSAWPLVALKELVDNALDACEAAGVAPKIDVTVTENFISVADNGGGIPASRVKQILNYANKTSSNAAYRSPTRGQQGNAFQTLIAMGHALTGKPSVTIIESRGAIHRITFSVDPISRAPSLDHQRADGGDTQGTKVTLYVPASAAALPDLHNAVIDYGWVNPHATLSFRTAGSDYDRSFTHEATDPDWTKWKPTDPTSPHWYDVGSMKTLMAAEINKARHSNDAQKTVAEFVSDFRGLSSTIKRRDICEAVSASRESLDAFFARGDDAIRRLRDQMKAASKPVRARDLGVIGEDHVLDMIASESGQYKRAEIDDCGVPYLIEAGFGHRPDLEDRAFGTGLNWSLSIGGNPFRDLYWGRSLGSVLESQHAGPEEPVSFFLHLASPCLKFRDTGKTSVSLSGKVIDAIIAVVKQVTKAWHRQREAEKRNADAKLRREDALKKAAKTTIKDAAYSIMAKAYAAASDNGTLPAEPRQIYYAARDDIMSLAQVSAVNADTFTQQLLIGYMHDHPKECAGWDIAFSDRGHFEEPHTGRVVGLGTLAVREYRGGYAKPDLIKAGFGGASIKTHGPEGRFGAILYIEKEGFAPLIERAEIAERFDLAIMSCKGMSVTAARQLIDQTCAKFNVPLFILRDFDIAGFSIARTLHQSNDRYEFKTRSGKDFKVVDLGLRLADVERLRLASERVVITKGKKGGYSALRARLKINGATPAEIEFLLSGRRVELNAMTSRQFVNLLESKLTAHGVRKVIPDAKGLADAYRLFARGAKTKAVVEEAMAAMAKETIAVPTNLERRVRAYLKAHPDSSWDDAIKTLVSEDGP